MIQWFNDPELSQPEQVTLTAGQEGCQGGEDRGWSCMVAAPLSQLRSYVVAVKGNFSNWTHLQICVIKCITLKQCC